MQVELSQLYTHRRTQPPLNMHCTFAYTARSRQVLNMLSLGVVKRSLTPSVSVLNFSAPIVCTNSMSLSNQHLSKSLARVTYRLSTNWNSASWLAAVLLRRGPCHLCLWFDWLESQCKVLVVAFLLPFMFRYFCFISEHCTYFALFNNTWLKPQLWRVMGAQTVLQLKFTVR